jgi:Nucleotide modification associated domain 3
MNGLLVRVAADQSLDGGGWNGPVNSATNDFVYVPIPEKSSVRPGLNTWYTDPLLQSALAKMGSGLPVHLSAKATHLDPDFGYLTYGDSESRANQIQNKLKSEDLLAFYSGMRDVNQRSGQLVYALIGLYVIEHIVLAAATPETQWHQNAHTRRMPIANKYQIVVHACPGVSGRLTKCIPIGSYRDRAYRVYPYLLGQWGALIVKNGYIQRSARLPQLGNAAQFYRWFLNQNISLIPVNN